MRLNVTRGPNKGDNLVLEGGRTYFIGRDATACQLIFSDAGISRKHASVFVDEKNRALITDNNSQNGTYLNNVRITVPAIINPGDIITIGENQLELNIEEDQHSGQKKQSDFYPSADSQRKTSALARGTVINLGRDPTSDIVLQHPHVSRYHAVIEVTAEGTLIRDLNSTNGTYVDGVKIIGSQKLDPDSEIRISGYRLTMEDFQVVSHDETAGQIELEVRDLSQVVVLPDGEERVILNNLNFTIKPREFVAVLGGSGAGKTTLLKALMGIWPAKFGELLLNGSNYYEQYGAFKSMIGYVPQDDIVHIDLTVEEVLNYTARLRMPGDTTPEEMASRVEEVLEVLDLTTRRSTLVRNLSGGQRKRVSIGVELITMPSIMFLDEPTSGLDPGLELVMMEMMRDMANHGQTIFLITHATFNIHLCDKVVFLSEGGRLAFFGTPSEALEYFGANDFAEIYKKINLLKSSEDWQCEYAMSPLAAKYQTHSRTAGSTSSPFVKSSQSRISSILQWYYLTRRYGQVMIRDRKNLSLLMLQPVIIAAIIGILFFNYAPVFEKSPIQPEELIVTEAVLLTGNTEAVAEKNVEAEKHRQNMAVIVFGMVISAIYFGATNSVREIVKEIVIYKRERLVNLRIAPYMMSKVTILALLCLIQTFFFLGIIKVFLGLPSFMLSALVFYLISISSVLMGLAVSAIASNSNVATSILPILLLPQVLLSGLLIPIEDVRPESLQVVFNLIVARWGFELLGGGIININELIAFEDKIRAFTGPFEIHWWALIIFVLVLYIVSTFALIRKDKDLS
jgi:ABC transport system ATP-binding/permease protein